MNSNMLCSKCGKRPAVVFISKIQGDDSTQEGLCLKCAMDMNIGPIKQFMEKMGITEEEVEAVSEQLGDAMDAMGGADGFEFGGAGTFPFMQGLMNGMGGMPMAKKEDNEAVSENNETTEVEQYFNEHFNGENIQQVSDELKKIYNKKIQQNKKYNKLR